MLLGVIIGPLGLYSFLKSYNKRKKTNQYLLKHSSLSSVDAYYMYNKDADLKTLFESFDGKLWSLAFSSRKEVEKIVFDNEEWISRNDRQVFLLFIEKTHGKTLLFVAQAFSNAFGRVGVHYINHLEIPSYVKPNKLVEGKCSNYIFVPNIQN